LTDWVAENVATIGYEYRRTRRRFRLVAVFRQAFVTHPDVRWIRGLAGLLV
jgi:hypothetical protein